MTRLRMNKKQGLSKDSPRFLSYSLNNKIICFSDFLSCMLGLSNKLCKFFSFFGKGDFPSACYEFSDGYMKIHKLNR